MEPTSTLEIPKTDKLKFLTLIPWKDVLQEDYAKYIREFYRLWQQEIYNEHQMYFDWTFFEPLTLWMTPIEVNVWEKLKTKGLFYYPQLPVTQYLLDFADPFKKIAIEVDSREWHQDVGKDIDRQWDIEWFDWKFYRIWGKDTYDPGALENFVNQIIEENYTESDGQAV